MKFAREVDPAPGDVYIDGQPVRPYRMTDPRQLLHGLLSVVSGTATRNPADVVVDVINEVARWQVIGDDEQVRTGPPLDIEIRGGQG